MITPADIADARKRLNGELPSGRLYESRISAVGKPTTYRDVNAEEAQPSRPHGWRTRQNKFIRGLLTVEEIALTPKAPFVGDAIEWFTDDDFAAINGLLNGK